MRVAVVVILVFLPGMLSAGAWPREAGHGFLSLSYEYTTWQDSFTDERLQQTEGEVETFAYTAFYGEYGLTNRLTFGVDLGEEDTPYTRTDVIFLRYAVGPLDWRHRFAVEMGVGRREISTFGLMRGDREQILRPGLAWGYGFDTPLGPGWAGLDLKAELRQTTDEDAYKADFTIGLNPEGPWLTFLQVQTNDYPNAPVSVRLAPSVVREITSWLALETAVLFDVHGNERMGVKAGIWVQF
ncbi:MAG: hypothetical protein AAGH83_06780 [Pseudomonadota bacterium]